MQKFEPTSHEEYQTFFDALVADRLEKIDKTLTNALPKAFRVISYQMPAFKTSEVLIYYAAFKTHISIFPTPSAVEAFKQELDEYITSKGTIQIKNDQPLPLKLIADIAKFREAEVKAKIDALTVQKTCRRGHVYGKSPICKSCPECAKIRN